MTTKRSENVFRAKVAWRAERYDEMVDFMKKVTSLDVVLSVEEQKLLSVAYNNVIVTRCNAWQIISSMEQKVENNDSEEKLRMINQYRLQVEKELQDTCLDLINVLEKHLIPYAVAWESKIFYYQMKGDYYRYLGAFTTGDERKKAAEHSLVAYKAASDISNQYLFPIHPIRLGVAMHLSVFYCKVLNDPKMAMRIFKKAYDEAIDEIDTLPNKNCEDVTLVLQVLKEQLLCLTSHVLGNGTEAEPNEQFQDVKDQDFS